ncbi:MAG: hypothetical protein MZV49_12635 [Rhodopseudomonas palustris]|nr:hypothetical protein [Rhodopseudomonas palustris]
MDRNFAWEKAIVLTPRPDIARTMLQMYFDEELEAELRCREGPRARRRNSRTSRGARRSASTSCTSSRARCGSAGGRSSSRCRRNSSAECRRGVLGVHGARDRRRPRADRPARAASVRGQARP